MDNAILNKLTKVLVNILTADTSADISKKVWDRYGTLYRAYKWKSFESSWKSGLRNKKEVKLVFIHNQNIKGLPFDIIHNIH